MKAVLNNYLKIAMYTIFGILFAMSAYVIILNVCHYRSLKDTVIVSEADNDYSKYKDNITLIEEKLNNYSKEGKLYTSLSKSVDVMKKNGVFRLVPKTELNYTKLYELNDYFLEELINNNWLVNIKELDISHKYQDTINLLSKNSVYLNSILTNNSLILYDNSLDTRIEDNYHFILSNYKAYSNIILDMCNELGGENGEVN